MSHQMKAGWLLAVAVAVSGAGRPCPADELKVIQKPTFWIVGQWTRILVETPVDCEKLDVTCPEQLTLLDRWPYKPGDKVQRFYFRAKAAFKNGAVTFKSAKYSLTLPLRVMSWEEALNERQEVEILPGSSWKGWIHLPRLFPIDGKDDRKSGISYLTKEELDKERKDLATNLKGRALQLVGETQDLERLFHALPESTVPRTCYVNNGHLGGPNPSRGCPVCGVKVFEGRSSFYPWALDPERHPLKLQCPECKRWFPSNDVAAGDMHSGEYPDDGWGYFDAQGRPYSFVGYYPTHFYREFRSVPTNFSAYYLASGDQRWGRAAALVMFRFAEQYLNLAWNLNQRERYTRAALWSARITPQGTPPPQVSGFYLDGIWSISPAPAWSRIVERIWDYFEREDPVLQKFLQEHHHPEMKSMRDVREFIVTGYFRTVAQGVLDGAVRGNGPSAEAMGMDLARFLNTPRAIDLVDWAFNNPAGGMRYYLSNNFFKDGSGYESPGYNNAHYGSTAAIADRLTHLAALRPEQYAKASLPSLADDPRFKSMYDHNINLSLISRTYANVGDDGDLAGTDPLPLRVGASLARHLWIPAFQQWPQNANYARAVWDAGAKAPIKELSDRALRDQATRIIQREGPYLELPSQVLDGCGHVILRSGKGDHQRALWMRYGRMYGHMHHDGLTIGYEALKRTLLPEQGYHRGELHRTEWDMNWAIHYCGRVVGGASEPESDWSRQGHAGGSLRLFAEGGWAQVATAGRRLHKEVDPPRLTELADDVLLERTIALVDLGPQHSYAVSIFRLGGGTDHYLSFHGPRGTAEATGLRLTAQKQGTLAGLDVPYGQKWDSEWGKQNRHLLTFPFLYDVHRARPEGPWNVRWDLEKHPQVHLRLHAVGTARGEVALCKGKPPGGGKPFELQWVMQHTHGAEPLATQFAEVLEAYEGQPLVTEVRPLTIETKDQGPQRPVAFQVVSGNRVDTIIHCQNPEFPVTTSNGVAMQGSFGVWSEQSGLMTRVFLAGGTQIAKGTQKFAAPARAFSGTITRADFLKKTILVTPAAEKPESLVGRYARITNPQGNDTTHLIVAARAVEDSVELTLELDPRIGEGPVKEVHDDGVTSAVRLMFEGLYYKGKTLTSQHGSVACKTNGVKNSRIYLHGGAQSAITKESLSRGFVAEKADDTARFLVYDYGPPDAVTVPAVLSISTAIQ